MDKIEEMEQWINNSLQVLDEKYPNKDECVKNLFIQAESIFKDNNFKIFANTLSGSEQEYLTKAETITLNCEKNYIGIRQIRFGLEDFLNQHKTTRENIENLYNMTDQLYWIVNQYPLNTVKLSDTTDKIKGLIFAKANDFNCIDYENIKKIEKICHDSKMIAKYSFKASETFNEEEKKICLDNINYFKERIETDYKEIDKQNSKENNKER